MPVSQCQRDYVYIDWVYIGQEIDTACKHGWQRTYRRMSFHQNPVGVWRHSNSFLLLGYNAENIHGSHISHSLNIKVSIP